jgi:hypothetical protein
MEKVFVTVLTVVKVDVLRVSVTGDGVIVSVKVVTVMGSSTVDVNAVAVYRGVVKLVDTETVVGV